MNKIIKLMLFSILILAGTNKTFATTWNEPWTDSVIKDADYFVLAEIIAYDKEKGVKIKIIKQLGGDKLPSEIEITDFYLLQLTSRSGGHGAEFQFKDIDKSYFFIKKNEAGAYCISTPTSGFSYVKDGNAYATYRHSYHQALVPIDVYEMTMTAIFNNYHHAPYDKAKIIRFIGDNLSKKPAGFDKDEINTFFLQHVSLELIYHLRLDSFYDKILPFFNDENNFHHRVSASRALIAYNSRKTIDLLYNKISTNQDDDFTTVICIWTLKEFKPSKIKKKLETLAENASTKHNSFGGNLMDPRVGTSLPTVKSALEDLIRTL